jgi:uncharacterized protein
LARLIVFLCSQFVALSVLAQGTLRPLPPLLQTVSDEVGAVSPDEGKALARRLANLHNDTGAKVVIVIAETTQPEEVEDYTGRLVRQWQQRTDALASGKYIFVVLAVKDRALWIEGGPGYAPRMEGLTEESFAAVRPYLQQGRYQRAIEVIMNRLEGLIRHSPT